MLSFVMTGSATNFNPRAPRGARLATTELLPYASTFQSTCPARGTTGVDEAKDFDKFVFQSTCPARGTTDWMEPEDNGDREFQSTCPARGTTANMHNFFVQICARVTNIPLKGMPYLQKTYVSI